MIQNADSGRVMDERAVALVVEWWMRTPVADYEEMSDEAAAFADVRQLFEHLEANGYTIADLAPNGRSGTP